MNDDHPLQIGATIEQSRERTASVLAELNQQGLSGFLVPLADEHQGEYVPPRAQRLAWLTGFNGSAGLAIVFERGSAIFVDGRYTLQVQDQVDTDLYIPQHLIEAPPKDWLKQQLKAGDKIGFDPWLHTPAGIKSIRLACEQAGAELVPCGQNPIDKVWHDQPAPPQAAVQPHALEYSGEESTSKRQRLAEQLTEQKLDTAVITLPDSIAWLLNIRGGDVSHNPVALGFALLHSDSRVDLFMDAVKISPEVRQHLGNSVSIQPPDQLAAGLAKLSNKKVRIDDKTAPVWVFEQLEKATAVIERGDDPCILPKACKNPVELVGTQRAHERDGVAVCRFLHWLSLQTETDELTAAAKLQAFRQDSTELQDLSFDTISGAGPNGAIVHYRVSTETNRQLTPGTLFLVDSGAQYRDGTTDITRTVLFASQQATVEQRDRFTRVLKGHIQLALARFPKKTSGSQLDVLARHALWQAGLDYDHGTGHGVGSYLSVHEGPQRISKVPNDVALKPGMILSNEPGYYKTGEYGIRIENLVVVTEAEDIPGGERPMHGFATLTLAPIDRHLIEANLLSEQELDWLNAYHQTVREKIAPRLDGEAQAWLNDSTQEIST